MGCFQVFGETITDSVRNLVVSGDWRTAFSVVTEDIDGLPYNDAIAILRGEKRLVGTGNMSVVDEDPKDEDIQAYKDDIRSVYVDGRLIYDGKRYKLYGKVTRVPTAYDLEYVIAKMKLENGEARYPMILPKQTDFREFVRPYLNDKNNDLIFHVAEASRPKHRIYALFERDTDDVDLPVWMVNAIPSDPQVAFDSMGGCVSHYGEIESSVPVREEPKTPSIERRPVEATTVSSSDGSSIKDFNLRLREATALNQAKEAGFETVADYSESLRQKVLEAIKERGDSWVSFTCSSLQEPRSIRYPKNLAGRYALMKTNASHLSPNWKAVSEPGLKMDNDNAVHTDLWLALGFDLDGSEYEHTSDQNMMLSELVFSIQKELLSYELHVLTAAGKESVYGRLVRHDDPNAAKIVASEPTILWVPHAGEEFAVLAMKSAAVLCEAGGKLAHLVVVGRELGIPVVRLPEGSKPLIPGAHATLDLRSGKISLQASHQPFFGIY